MPATPELPQFSEDPDVVDREPVAVFLTGLAGVVGLGLGAATALDWLPLTAGQTVVVVGFVAGVTTLIGQVLRARVWSPATVAQLPTATDTEFS